MHAVTSRKVNSTERRIFPESLRCRICPTVCFTALIHQTLMLLLSVPKLRDKSFAPTSQEAWRCRSSAPLGQVRLHFANFSLSRGIDAEMQFSSRGGTVRGRPHSERPVFIDPVKASKAAEQLRCGPRGGRRCCFCCVIFFAQTDTSLLGFFLGRGGVGGVCCNDCNQQLKVNRAAKFPPSAHGRVRALRQNRKIQIKRTFCPSSF